MKKLFLLFTLLSTFVLVAQTTYVPDDNFENYLETHDASGNVVPLGSPNSMGNGIANDDYVFTNRINSVTNLDVSNQNISDLTGISDFSQLQILDCSDNSISSLNLNLLTVLMELHCSTNNLTSLDVQANSFLTVLKCGDNNNLSSITFNVTNNLKILDFINTGITGMNLSNFTALEELNCGSNLSNIISPLNSLILTNTPQLKKVSISLTKLTTLDLSNHAHFFYVAVGSNSLLTQINLSNTVDTSNSNFNGIYVTNNAILNSVNMSNASFKHLSIYGNPTLSSLNLTTTNIQDTFDCSDNNLSSIQVNSYTSLTDFRCNNNKITNLQVSNLTNLTFLDCSNNLLNSLDVTNLTNLTNLFCSNNSISNLNLSAITNLNILNCSHNNLTSLDVTSNTSLNNINSSFNQLTSLDVSNVNLLKLYTNDNNLKALNLQNNSALFYFSAINNPNLSCINVDNVANANAMTDWFKDATASYSTNCYVYVPDDNFEQELINLGYDDVLNDYVARVFIENVTTLSLSNKNIANLTGIEGFIYLVNLDVSYNSLNVVNLSQNTTLQTLNISNNGLVALDVSNNTNLTELKCQSNTNISSLDVSTNTSLTKLWCYANKIQQLNLNNNSSLTDIRCQSNQLNRMTIKNQNNSAITVFSAHTNPNLTCIEVDDPVLLTTNFSGNIDAQTQFSSNCHYDETYIPDTIFEAYLETHDANGNIVAVGNGNSMGNGVSGDHYVTTANINSVTNLNVSNLGISDLTGIQDFTALTHLNAGDNSLSSININTNTHLTVLQLYNNSLTSIDVSALTSLEEIYVNNNSLTALDVTASTNMKKIYCYNNQITGNNLKFFYETISLTHLLCQNNQITNLELANTYVVGYWEIDNLDCSNNQITEIDLSAYQFTSLNCSNNNLTLLNVKNNSNTYLNVTSFNCLNNPNLTCIEVDNPTYSTTNWTNKDATASYNTNCHYGETYVPDDNFENYLETHDANGNVVVLGASNSMGNGIANDDYVFTSSINTVTNLDVSNESITDLTGIEDFTALQVLDCSINILSGLDVSSNVNLTNLYCVSNQIASLDVSQNTSLTELNCGDNNLTSLDVTQNTSLIKLFCQLNQLTSLDVTQNIALTSLFVVGNQINYLDVNSNVNLVYLDCLNNQLTSLSVYYNNNLQILNCNNNQINNLILPNQITNLQQLDCSDNKIASLDLSAYSNLTRIICNDNLLTQLNVKNGNNTNISNADFYATNNPNLGCIQVDNATWSTTNWTNKDVTSSYSNNCGYNETFVPDDNFESYLETHNPSGNIVPLGDPNSMGNGVANDNFVTTAKINSVTTLNISNQSISDITGIKDFTALTDLNCANNNLSVLDLDFNTALVNLDCNNNSIPSLNLLANVSLATLSCTDNNMDDLHVAPNTLSILYCQNNSLQYLDLSQMYNLIDVNCSNNQLSNLSVINSGSNLQILNINNNSFTGIDVSNNPNLQEFYCNHNQITNAGLNLNSQANLLVLDCSFNQLTALDMHFNPLLQDLICTDNLITAIDLQQNGALVTLDCSNNQLTSLVPVSTNLLSLKCENNQLTNLDLNGSTHIEELIANTNHIPAIDLTNANALLAVFLNNNQLTSLNVTASSNLVVLECKNNVLETVLMNNGNNQSVTNFNATNNDYLTCIQVDDVSIPQAPVWQKDATASYTQNCGTATKIWENGAWTNGTPTINDNAIIRDDYYTSDGDIEAKTLTIDSGFTLTVESGNYVKVAQNMYNNGTLYVDVEGSYVQINNLAKNLGTGTYQCLINTTQLADDDRFTYFSSPVKNATLQVFNSWAKMNYIWDFDANIQDWNHLNGNETMPALKGFAVEPSASNTFPFVASTTFTGEFNNGQFTTNLVYNPGGIDDDSILIGNPYPSAVDATMLLNQNSGANAFYFWTHKSALGATGYLGDDYAIWNNSGGIASASGSPAPTGYIASGQGFFATASAYGTITFNNAMRTTTNNNDFRRPDNTSDKIWINLISDEGNFSQTLIAFIPQGTDGFDPTYDATRLNSGANVVAYSIGQNNEHFGIDARPILNGEKVLNYGIEIQNTTNATFTIAIDHLENFENATVFLRDNLLNVVHNLKQSDYTFTTNNTGEINNRFELWFNRSALSVEENTNTPTEIIIANSNDNQIIVITSDNSTIKKIKVYDILGKLLANKTVNNSNTTINLNVNEGTILFVNSLLEDNTIIIKKIVSK